MSPPPRRLSLAAAALALVAIVVGVGLFAWSVRPWEPMHAETIQDGLEHPWDLAFAADGRMVVTERAGTVAVFASAEPGAPLLDRATVPDVRAELESGLMGIAADGDTLYVCATRGATAAEPWRVDLLRATLGPDGMLSTFTPMPLGPTIGGPRHQGCAVEIGPDRHLWLTIGDASRPAGENPAQDPGILNGSVVRLTLEGAIPDGAPFPSGVHSFGHRNPQGIAFAADGVPYTVEHGTDVNDEINRIVAGGNYGYPCWTGAAETGPIPDGCGAPTDYLAPAWASGASTLATSGAAFLDDPSWGTWAGNLVVTTLKEEDIRRFELLPDGTARLAETLLDRRFGRLRAAVIGPDGALYVTTSNGPGDRIIRLTPRR